MGRGLFSSNLVITDIMTFLITFGELSEFTITHFSRNKSTGIIAYVSCVDREYKLVGEDFDLRIFKLHNGKEWNVAEVKPSADDWFCFLKSKFGEEYVSYYATILDAKTIIYNNSYFLSKLSFDEICNIVVQVLKKNANRFPNIDYTKLKIKEVESFYNSERRFWIVDSSTNLRFYMRLSDSNVIVPSLNGTPYRVCMMEKFGKEYINAFAHKSLIFYKK